MKLSNDAPLTWQSTLGFVVLATLLVALIGWLTGAGIGPMQRTIGYSESGWEFIRIWIRLAIGIGLILPSVACLVWWRHPIPRKIFGFYLLVLIVQIVTEQIFSTVWFPSLVVSIGTFYTVFRLWQLWQSRQLLRTVFNLPGQQLLWGLLGLLLLFWASNLVMLLVLDWPIILHGT